MNSLGAIILAAGKGSRMKSKTTNKVALVLGNKPMVLHGIHLLKNAGIKNIVVVVGFAKDSVRQIIKEDVIFAEQAKRLGTAHAAHKGMLILPVYVKDVLIIQGDDSAFYKEQTIRDLILLHKKEGNALTFLTLNVDNPTGLGRVIRDKNGNLLRVVEERDATKTEKKITEVNPACYVASMTFLKKYLAKVRKSPVTSEYYLTSVIDIAIKNNQKVNTLSAGKILWRGVNTGEELTEAQRLFQKLNPNFSPS